MPDRKVKSAASDRFLCTNLSKHLVAFIVLRLEIEDYMVCRASGLVRV